MEILDVDAAIIFADLLLPVEPMGLKLRFATGEGPHDRQPGAHHRRRGFAFHHQHRRSGLRRRGHPDVVRALAGKVPVIGFVGAPFTMASYMIEGGASRNFIRTKQLMYTDETLWRRLMGKIVDVLAPFAHLQVAAGARAIQVFDSWVGALGPDDYVRFAAPYSRALIERIRSTGVPVIHFGTGASGFFRELHAAGGDVMGVDWRINIDQAWMDISYRSAIQGNLDPVALFAPLPELKHQGARTAEAHRHAARPHLQPGPRHSAGDAGGEREGRGGDGPGIPAVKAGGASCWPTARRSGWRTWRATSRSCAAAGPASPKILEEVRHRYAAIGGSSPLLGWTRAQAEALEKLLGMPVFFGMRNWHPFIRETMERISDAGVERMAAHLPGAAVFRAERGPLHPPHRRGRARGRRDGGDRAGPRAFTMSRC